MTCFRQLAINAVASIAKGQRILVSGRLRVRDWESGDRAGTTVEIDADALGHDLAWGTTVYTRSVSSTIANDADHSRDDHSSDDQSSDDRPGDRPAVLEEPAEDSVDAPGADRESESGDLLAAALPF